jgi:hypothetical protein
MRARQVIDGATVNRAPCVSYGVSIDPPRRAVSSRKEAAFGRGTSRYRRFEDPHDACTSSNRAVDMAVGNRHVDVKKALQEAEDAARLGPLSTVEWISAAAAVELIKPHFNNSAFSATRRICEHANARLVRARARRYMIGEATRDDSVVPHVFGGRKGIKL